MAKNQENDENKEYLPPLEFASLVFPFYTQALIKLGMIEDPVLGTESPRTSNWPRD